VAAEEKEAKEAEQQRQRDRLVPSDEVYVIQGSSRCDGRYIMISSVVVNGRNIWECTSKDKASGGNIWECTFQDKALYLSNSGKWLCSTKANARDGANSASMLLEGQSDGQSDKYSPSSLDTRQWKEVVAGEWTVKPNVRVLQSVKARDAPNSCSWKSAVVLDRHGVCLNWTRESAQTHCETGESGRCSLKGSTTALTCVPKVVAFA
jgi:hypothetical protein